ncbi:hypothetical protein SUGI_0449990 [Cryptomeria japonica]|nr:hypothetical protein SUGI_0449990 [Cryptomeria japonica]
MTMAMFSQVAFAGCRAHPNHEHPTHFHYRSVCTKFSKQYKSAETFQFERKNYLGVRRKEFSVKCSGVSFDEVVEQAKEMIKCDNGPTRWFTPLNCGRPPPNAPLLLYLPGMDGTGLGLSLHHRHLGELFEVRCLHIPVMDRTSFEGLLPFVKEALMLECGGANSRPIYLVGECLGACLALAVAAHNPDIDLTLVLVNPATCFSRSQLQSWFPIMDSLSNELSSILPFKATDILGDLVCAGLANRGWSPPSVQRTLATLIPRESLLWKFRMLRSAELYTNARLHAVKAHVLLVASGNDQLFPSAEEALRLKKVLKNCKIRYFKDSSHSFLLEDGMQLSTVIKGVGFYRHSRARDHVSDFIPPTQEEFGRVYEEHGLMRKLVSPVMFSTNQNGKIMKGLAGIPQEGPCIFVGIHMLMGLDIPFLGLELLRQRNILVRGIAHPIMFDDYLEGELQEMSFYDTVRLHGAVPASGKNLHKLLSSKSFVLLYPGGAREALHRKGEQYKLFWPEKAEFVRMAARFDATIVPFGIVGEDDIAEVLLDYEDVIHIPFYRDMVEDVNKEIRNIRSNASGEVANQPMYMPFMAPKPPGRLYILFGKPILTAGRKDELEDKANVNNLYLQVKGEVEAAITYLLRKREEDPYRHFLPRFIYEAASGFTVQMPTFDP